MLRLERLRADHRDSLLAFERENREYFARSVPDRGDAYFAEFDARHRALLAEQDEGACHFHLVIDEAGGDVAGRVNLVDAEDGVAELGYRIGARSAGRGMATAAVAKVCALAASQYGLRALTAVTTLDNAASAAVLGRSGFEVVGELTVDGRPGLSHRKALTARS
ncbi:GNAT family N-acetyltransferase [Streptomyces sp. NPDC006544]|uniref:GNAT family N-acetyltransferase n=1 Tax=Streptomyces sp. NPDC006544 TaxID=3154583 RepID=UPI0033B4765D